MTDAERDAWLRVAKALEYIWVNLRTDPALARLGDGTLVGAAAEAGGAAGTWDGGWDRGDEGRGG